MISIAANAQHTDKENAEKILFLSFFFLSWKINFYISFESSACQELFSMKKKKKKKKIRMWPATNFAWCFKVHKPM